MFGSQGKAYYIVGDGEYADHTLAHINEVISERGFDATVKDLRDKVGLISVQGPKRFDILFESFL